MTIKQRTNTYGRGDFMISTEELNCRDLLKKWNAE